MKIRTIFGTSLSFFLLALGFQNCGSFSALTAGNSTQSSGSLSEGWLEARFVQANGRSCDLNSTRHRATSVIDWTRMISVPLAAFDQGTCELHCANNNADYCAIGKTLQGQSFCYAYPAGSLTFTPDPNVEVRYGDWEAHYTVACQAAGVQPSNPARSISIFDLKYSFAGPLPGLHCVSLNEPSDPDTWSDNYLCSPKDLGLKFSFFDPIPGMACTQMNEPSDPHAWQDNYLCAPENADFVWSFAGPLAGHNCLQILEPSDPYTWNDNYLCQKP